VLSHIRISDLEFNTQKLPLHGYGRYLPKEINYSKKQNIASSVWQCGVPFPVSGQVGTDQIILAVLAGLRTLVCKRYKNRLKDFRNGPDHPQQILQNKELLGKFFYL
jgi:hypothetical protein